MECKGIRLDIYVKDENNTVYNIEMQRTDNKNLGKRMRYYQGNIDLDCITKGQDYRELTKSYVIFICTFDYFKKGLHEYVFENTCIKDSNIKLNDGTYKIILNTKGSESDIDSELVEFLEYIEKSNTETAQKASGELVKHIHKRVMEVKNDASVEVEFMTLLERDREKIEEGKIEGIELTKKVFKLNNKGISIHEIAKECEISEEDVLKILE